jgi:hypothetical protein
MPIGPGLPRFNFNYASITENAPMQSGVYAIYNQNWVYFGEGQDSRARLLAHLNGDNACITRGWHTLKTSGVAYPLRIL